ncbi:MAG: hypothetical protein ACYTBJ_26810 [Planctomycetota bacterium]|jgi:hypothetical protein
MFGTRIMTALLAASFLLAAAAEGGPYTEAGINGYLGADDIPGLGNRLRGLYAVR